MLERINEIGVVTLEKEESIKEARQAYGSLNSNEQEQLKEQGALRKLEDAEEAIKSLKKVDAVEKLISAIGSNVSLDSKNAVDRARVAYDALTDTEKQKVKNAATLTAAQAKIAELEAAQKVEQKPNVNTTPVNNNNGAVGQLTLNKTKATIYTKGVKTVTLKAYYNGQALGGSAVQWQSSNTKIAKISQTGKVTAKKKGKVTITATYNGVSTKIIVNVKKPTLKLKKSKATLNVNKKVKIRATAKPAKKITYRSNNKKVATVSKKGVVTAKGRGTAKITVKANGVKKTFKVTVK